MEPAPQPPISPLAPSPVASPRRPWWRRAAGAIAAAAIVIANFAAKLKALVFLLPKLKLLTTSGTMLVSVAAYALIWGWTFAVGFVVLLFIHEMGHVIALRREGVKASAPVFIPFLGAFIGARSLGGDALAEARVGLAGPILGSAAAAVCLLIHALTGNDYWLALAFVGFFLNLFNLLPVPPLDGGRAMAVMPPAIWALGLVALVAMAVFFPNPIVLLILVFAASETWKRWRARRSGSPEQRAYYAVKPSARLAVGLVYVGLAVALAFGMHATHLVRTLAQA